MSDRSKGLLVALALSFAACTTTAAQHNAGLSPAHPLYDILEQPGQAATFSPGALLKAPWAFPLTLEHPQKAAENVSNCHQLLELIEQGYRHQQPSEFGLVQAYHSICKATKDSEALQPYRHNHLPQPLFSESFPVQAPADFMVAISDSQRKLAKQSSSWQAASPIREHRLQSPHEAVYISEQGAIQHLFLVATGDYNGDQVADAIVYMESALEAGSYATSRYLIITRDGPEAPITVVKSVWPGG
ncbi:MAG: hypothetical protein WED00_11685 [Aquisalimonadaceae bacterium]